MAGYGDVACMRGASRAARVAAERGTSTRGAARDHKRVRNRRRWPKPRRAVAGQRPCFSAEERGRRKLWMDLFVIIEKLRGLFVNSNFPLIQGSNEKVPNNFRVMQILTRPKDLEIFSKMQKNFISLRKNTFNNKYSYTFGLKCNIATKLSINSLFARRPLTKLKLLPKSNLFAQRHL